MFFLNLSQELKLVLLLYLGPWAMAIHCRAVKNSLRGTDVKPEAQLERVNI
jgi:hypothetical protein